jgi:hypothetical protein
LSSTRRTSRARRKRSPRGHSDVFIQSTGPPMESFKPRVGKPITPEQFDELSDEQLVRLIPKAYREFFPGKDFCADGHFYLHDGTAWSFYRGDLLDE